jgi:hypothetical protein
VVSKHALSGFDPLILLPVQLTSSVLFLLVAVRVRGEAVIWSPQMGRLALLGVLMSTLASRTH